MTTIHDEIESLKRNSGMVGMHHATNAEAVADDRRATIALFSSVLHAIEPAMDALCSRAKVASSRGGCAVHELKPGEEVHGDMLGFEPLPSLLIGKDGDFYVDEVEKDFCPNCFRWVWVKTASLEVLRRTPIETLVRGIALKLQEQVEGGKNKRSRQLTTRARRLRALAELLEIEAEGGR